MLDLLRTRMVDSFTLPLYQGSAFVEEGIMLGTNAGMFDGTTFNIGVIGTPVATDRFVGVAYSYFTQPAYDNFGESVTVPSAAPYTVNLTNVPNTVVAGMLVKTSAGTVLTYNAAAGAVGAGQYNITGNVLTFGADSAGLGVFVIYRFAITALQAQFSYGDGVAGHTVASDVTSTMGFIRAGQVSTTCFNPGVDYSTNPVLRMGANGLIDPTFAAGPVIPGSYVVQPPSADAPYLVFYFKA